MLLRDMALGMILSVGGFTGVSALRAVAIIEFC
jgi:hypothetical protein